MFLVSQTVEPVNPSYITVLYIHTYIYYQNVLCYYVCLDASFEKKSILQVSGLQQLFEIHRHHAGSLTRSLFFSVMRNVTRFNSDIGCRSRTTCNSELALIAEDSLTVAAPHEGR